MFVHSTLLAGLALASSVSAQASPTAYVEPTVPTGKPIAGNYGGALRPQIHYSPPKDFMVSVVAEWRPALSSRPFERVTSLAARKERLSRKINEDSICQKLLWSCQLLLIFWHFRTIRMACSWTLMESTICTTNVYIASLQLTMISHR